MKRLPTFLCNYSIIWAISALLLIMILQSGCLGGSTQKTQKTPIILKPDIPDKQTQSQPPTPPQPPPVNTTIPTTKIPDSPPKEEYIPTQQQDTPHETNKIKTEPAIYQIALMLPLGLQYFVPNAANDSVPENALLALEFYEGALLALDKLQQEGVPIQATLYDTDNNPTTSQQILNQPQLQNAHLIIGPVYAKELKPVAAFSQQHNIPHISPLSPSGAVTSGNPHYLIANPSIEAQCAAIYRYIAQNYPVNKRIVAVCANKPNEIALANLFYRFGQFFGNATAEFSAPIPVSQFVYNRAGIADIENYLSANEENMIVVTSFDNLLVYDLSTKLNLLRNKYKITLFGMPNWLSFETIELEYLANLNLHLPLPFWQDKTNPDVAAFKRLYFQTYKTTPSEYACRGYDLVMWAGRALKNNGKDFYRRPHEVNSKGLFTNYIFEPSWVNQYTQPTALPNTDFLENKFTNIVRFKPDTGFERVNR